MSWSARWTDEGDAGWRDMGTRPHIESPRQLACEFVQELCDVDPSFWAHAESEGLKVDVMRDGQISQWVVFGEAIPSFSARPRPEGKTT